MCGFCEALTGDGKRITWSVRSVYAADNITEVLEAEENFVQFELTSYQHDGNTFVGVDYLQELEVADKEKIIIHPFSESIQFNFCPICGKQISKTVKDFKDYSESFIEVADRSNVR